MYHRFDEEKYPSTNIQLDIFKEQLNIIENQGIRFIHPKNFKENLSKNKKERKVLLTIDDGFMSFYKNAWPVLKEKKIPFILFISTREVGVTNYMTWNQIRELDKENFVEIGNHSHSHEYLVDENKDLITADIEKSISILPRSSEILDHLGDCYLMLNRKNEAIFEWKKAIKYETDTDIIKYIEEKLKKYE